MLVSYSYSYDPDEPFVARTSRTAADTYSAGNVTNESSGDYLDYAGGTPNGHNSAYVTFHNQATASVPGAGNNEGETWGTRYTSFDYSGGTSSYSDSATFTTSSTTITGTGTSPLTTYVLSTSTASGSSGFGAYTYSVPRASGTSAGSLTYHPVVTTATTVNTSAVTTYSFSYPGYSTTYSTTTNVSTSRPTLKTATGSTATSTFSALGTTSTTLPNRPYYINTVILFEDTNPEILWLWTATDTSMTGPLSDLAQSYVTDLTLFKTDYYSSSGGAFTSSSGSFSTYSSSVTRAGVTYTYHEGGAAIEATPGTAHIFYLGTFTVDTFPVYAQGDFETIGVLIDSSSYSVSGNSLSSFTQTAYQQTTTTWQILSSFTANDFIDDGFYTYSPESFRGRGMRSTTVSTNQAFPIVTLTDVRSVPVHTFSYPILSNATHNEGAAFTDWLNRIPGVSEAEQYIDNEAIVPTAAIGWAGFNTAGEQANLWRGLAVTMDADLQPYAIAVGFLGLVQQQSVFYADTASCTTYYRGPDYEEGGATLVFASVSGSTNEVTLTAQLENGATGKMTVGFESAFNLANETGHRLAVIEYVNPFFETGPLNFFGGRQAVAGKQQTMRAYQGHLRRMTMVDSGGNSTTGLTHRTTVETSVIPTNQLVFESDIRIHSFEAGNWLVKPKFSPAATAATKPPPLPF